MILRALVLVAFVCLPAVALADIAPPPGYEEQCTIELVQQAGELCELCTGAYHGDRDYCQREFGEHGYEHRCRTRGASTWREVWCRAADGDGIDEGSAAAAAPATETDAPGQEEAPEAAPTDEAAPGEESTLPADPPARTRGCSAAGGRAAGSMALLFALVAWRRRD